MASLLDYWVEGRSIHPFWQQTPLDAAVPAGWQAEKEFV